MINPSNHCLSRNPMPLPRIVEELTPDWLTSALSERWPGTKVVAVRRLDEIVGTATKFRLELQYASRNADVPPKTMFVKFGASDFQFKNVAEMGLYECEVNAYKRILNRGGPFAFQFSRPDCYFGAFQTDPIQGVLLLEDLKARDAAFNVALRPLTEAQAAEGLATLAELHGRTWNRQKLTMVQPALTSVGPLYAHEVTIAKKLFGNLRGHVIPLAFQDLSRYRAAWTKYVELVRSGPTCLLHGDSHVGNSYMTAEGRLGLLDWQLMSRGLWIHDVAYFIVSALDPPVRRRAERELLRRYLDELKKYGVEAPDVGSAWTLYRQAILYSLVIWLGNPDLCQPPEVNLTCLARTAIALMDLDPFAALGV